MRFRYAVVQMMIAFSILAIANIGISRLAHNSLPRQLLAQAERADPSTDLFLGNSTMACAVDEVAFAESAPGRRPLNLGLGATGPVEHFLIYRRQEKHAGAAIYYGHFDRQLTEPATAQPDTLIGNRALAYYVDPSQAYKFYAGDSDFRTFRFHLAGFFPAYIERSAVWGRVEKVRRSLGRIGLPEQEETRFGRVADFDSLMTSSTDFSLDCLRAVHDRASLSPPILEILDVARMRRVAVYFVEMPMPSAHRRSHNSSEEWVLYRKYLSELMRDSGVIDIPAGDWVSDAGFADAIHMNEIGARTFSSKLGDMARNRP